MSQSSLRELLVEQRGTQLQAPMEIRMYDRQHRLTNNPWDLLHKKGEALIKLVTSRPFQVSSTPHHMVLQVRSGIRMNLFYDIRSDSDDEEHFDDKIYWDHIHHMADVVAQELRFGNRERKIVKNNIKKEVGSLRLSDVSKQLIVQVRKVLSEIMLVGTSSIAIAKDPQVFLNGSSGRHQFDLFEDEGIPPEIAAELMAEFEDEQEMPLFQESQWKVALPYWSPGTVADFLPQELSHSVSSLQKRISDYIIDFLQGTL